MLGALYNFNLFNYISTTIMLLSALFTFLSLLQLLISLKLPKVNFQVVSACRGNSEIDNDVCFSEGGELYGG